MTNNYGSGIIFTLNGVSQGLVTGEVLSFDLGKESDVKEFTDRGNNTIYVGFSKRIKTATTEVLFTGSGSALTLPNTGDTGTLVAPWSADVSGSWGVIKSSLTGKNDDAVKVKLELKQWINNNGTSLP